METDRVGGWLPTQILKPSEWNIGDFTGKATALLLFPIRNPKTVNQHTSFFFLLTFNRKWHFDPIKTKRPYPEDKFDQTLKVVLLIA